VHRDLDAALDLANVLEVGIEPGLIARAQVLLEERNLLRDGIENTGVLLAPREALLRTRAVAEQALEGHARIHFGGKRLRGRGPGDRVRVGATVAPVAVAEITGVLDAELKGGQDRVLAVLVGDQLIDGDAQ